LKTDALVDAIWQKQLLSYSALAFIWKLLQKILLIIFLFFSAEWTIFNRFLSSLHNVITTMYNMPQMKFVGHNYTVK